MQTQLLNNQADYQSWQTNLEKPLHGTLSEPANYPTVVVWNINVNEWDSKSWIDFEYVYPTHFTQASS